jgi:hypothetical protein
MARGATEYAKGPLEATFDELIAILALVLFGLGMVTSLLQAYLWFIDGLWLPLSTLGVAEDLGLDAIRNLFRDYIGARKTVMRLLGIPFPTFLFLLSALIPITFELVKAETEALNRQRIFLKRWAQRNRKWIY